MSVERLEKIREEMNELLVEAIKIVRNSGNKFAYNRAYAYWIGHIDNALNKNNPYDVTILDTIKELDDEEESEIEES